MDWDYQTGDPDPEPEALDSMFLEHYYTSVPAAGEYVVENVLRIVAWEDDGAGSFSPISSYETAIRIEDELWGIEGDVEYLAGDAVDVNVNATFNQETTVSGTLADVVRAVDEDGDPALDWDGIPISVNGMGNATSAGPRSPIRLICREFRYPARITWNLTRPPPSPRQTR